MIKKVLVIVFKKTMRGYEFLTLKRADDGVWQPLSGTIEKGETPLETAKRELKEETGIDNPIRIVNPEIVNTFTSKNGNDYHETVFGFEVSQDMEELKLSSEHKSYSWMNQESAIALLEYKENKNALRSICDKIGA